MFGFQCQDAKAVEQAITCFAIAWWIKHVGTFYVCQKRLRDAMRDNIYYYCLIVSVICKETRLRTSMDSHFATFHLFFSAWVPRASSLFSSSRDFAHQIEGAQPRAFPTLNLIIFKTWHASSKEMLGSCIKSGSLRSQSFTVRAFSIVSASVSATVWSRCMQAKKRSRSLN